MVPPQKHLFRGRTKARLSSYGECPWDSPGAKGSEPMNGLILSNRIIEGVGMVAAMDAEGAVGDDGRVLRFDDASLRQLRQLAGVARLGSGVWRAGAAKADLLAALKGEIVDFSVREPDPILVPKPALARQPEPVVDGEIFHKDFEVVLAAVKARVPVWLVGPAGSGKSSLAKKVAKRLGIPFFARSVSAQSSESSLLGFIDANGRLVRSALREAFEHGGLFLLDEVDAGSPAVMVVLNSLVANGWASFPDGMIEAHPDFRIIAGANCYGSGSDRQYVGRQQQDAAMLDRFAFVGMGYDLRIMRASMGLKPKRAEKSEYVVGEAPAGEALEALLERWFDRVVSMMEKIARQSVRHIVGQRAAELGAKLLREGVAFESAEKMLLRKGLADDVWLRIAA